MSEQETIWTFVGSLFISIAIFGPYRESMPAALAHERDEVLIIMSSRGRLLKIPRETTIKDVVAGARWPRQPSAPVFEDLCRAPRNRIDEIDGVDLEMGWCMVIYVVTKDKLGAL